MPLYEFMCNECGDTKEVLQSYQANVPICCGKPMQRGCGSLRSWFWKGGDVGHMPNSDSKSLSQAATRGWQTVHKK